MICGLFHHSNLFSKRVNQSRCNHVQEKCLLRRSRELRPLLDRGTRGRVVQGFNRKPNSVGKSRHGQLRDKLRNHHRN